MQNKFFHYQSQNDRRSIKVPFTSCSVFTAQQLDIRKDLDSSRKLEILLQREDILNSLIFSTALFQSTSLSGSGFLIQALYVQNSKSGRRLLFSAFDEETFYNLKLEANYKKSTSDIVELSNGRRYPIWSQ